MILREHNFGLGSLVYARRVVEETTLELLGLLEEAIREAGGNIEPAIAAIKEAREGKTFEDIVRLAANAVPDHLRLGGANPLALLFEPLSDGIHARTDEDAIEIVDGMQQILELKKQIACREEIKKARSATEE